MRMAKNLKGFNFVQACRLVLEAVHSLWEPLEGRIKNYIASPKPNGYQSLHATVRLPTVTFDMETQPPPSSAPPDMGGDGSAASAQTCPLGEPMSAAAAQSSIEEAAVLGPSMEVQIRTRGQLFSSLLLVLCMLKWTNAAPISQLQEVNADAVWLSVVCFCILVLPIW